MCKRCIKYSLLIIAVISVLSSCDDNSRSLGSFQINLATVVSESDRAFYLLLDNGTKLWPAAADISYKPENNQRVFVNYTILSDKIGEYDNYIKINDMWNILTKEAIELNATNADSIGNDPIKINDIWVGGDYLNVSFMFNYGGIRPHAINLVKNTLEQEEDNETIELEFRHNSYDSSENRLYEGFVCFDLKPFRNNEVDSVKLSIKTLEWTDSGSTEGKEITHDVIYRYNQPAIRSISEVPMPVISSSEYY